ncbi:MAG: SMP-30/gluconolactonase/LRE family protein [Pyrinomonadaceae bacterium]|nr:SMP-30/gluconolactonase/LRE family protein [Pyrinomonadaceae bacterium]
MQILRFRSFTVIVLAVFAQCLFCAENVRAHEGWGIVVDRQGQIYFSDIPTNTIWRITRDGKLEAFLHDKHSHALILSENGTIYGTHEHHAASVGGVWWIAPDGGFSDVFTPTADFPLNLHPFIIDRNGNIYSTNSISFPNQSDKTTLLKATPGGDVTILAGGIRGFRDGRGGEAQFSGIDGMAWAADGSLYVTDGVYVRRVAMDGTVTTLGGGALTSQSYGEDLMGLAVTPSGSVYVADYSQRRVLQLMPDGNTRTILETGLFWSPTGITIVGEELYVLEHLRMPLVILGDLGIGAYARVRKISPDGTVEKIATVWGRNTLTSSIVLLAIGALFIFVWRVRRRRNMSRSPRTATA